MLTHFGASDISFNDKIYDRVLHKDPELYDQSNYTNLQWPSGTEYEHDYITPLLATGSQDYVSNVQSSLFVLKIADHLFPLTVNDADYENAYVCSPFTRYITYAKRELGTVINRWQMNVLIPLLNGFGAFLKTANINKVACVNNWLLSTNLYPNMDGLSTKTLTDFMVARFPNHAIMFPSLNRHTNASLIDQLEKEGYQLIPSREVFIFDRSLKDYPKRRVTQSDLDLLKKTPYQIVTHQEIFESDYKKIVELYTALYINKYSFCNPFFTQKFIRLCHQKNLMNFQGLRNKKGDLVGFISSFNRNGVLATPLVGYDISLPLNDGIYRMLTALAIKEALESNLIFNMSAGVSEFKKWRGGVGFIEYNAVYHKHLPFYRRKGWNILKWAMDRFGLYCLRNNNF